VRIASRHMPKLKHRRPGVAVWLLLLSLATSLGYVALAKPKPFFAVLGVVAVLFWLSHLQGKREERRLLALASAREGQTICEFARDFDARAVDTWVIRAAYEQLQGQLKHVHPAFPVRGDDRLKEDLFIDDDDLDMGLAQEVEERTGRSLDGSASNPYFGKVRTVRDFVLFFQSQPKSSSAT
jgi:hypothetical protein